MKKQILAVTQRLAVINAAQLNVRLSRKRDIAGRRWHTEERKISESLQHWNRNLQ